ncbi:MULTISPECIES: HAMP domain-containing sensor histidine kinase [Kosmotoga]|uniref:histidine kinase n=1 Tax=Kosmotoga olearia (strain ATCC BAA-1733 / DSM 21960 / TBF 19.5.1) TaxID=521045 RepID=C5CE18_KOSOT|nr:MULTISPECIES: HAMP domain-containing sensor histidine kinase [Kosmotoga]ACR80120.1 histidine kinase [Kosmotoga olearia TBF 19.5.1]OAA20311.1 hypothetical protein DU53_07900 [Kosmotoga sp. DU53]
MTLKAKISLLYLIAYGSSLLFLAAFLYAIVYDLKYREVDNRLLAFYGNIVRAYTIGNAPRTGLLNLPGSEDLGFEIYKNDRLIASFRIKGGLFKNVEAPGTGFGNYGNYRYYISEESVNGAQYKFVVAHNLAPIRNFLKNLLIALIAGSLFVVILITLIGIFITRKLLNPIGEIGKQLEEISHTEIDGRRVNVKITGSEIARLQSEVNKSLKRLELLIKDAKALSAKIAHELRTPLSVLKSTLQLALARNDSVDSMKRSLKESLRELDNLIQTSNDLLLISNIEKGIVNRFKPFDLSQTVLDVIENQMVLNPDKQFHINVPPAVTFNGVETLLARAVANLIENAVKYSREGTIEIKLKCDDKSIIIEIINPGEEIPPQELERIFENFYRRKNVDKIEGYGLGLSVARAVAKLHGGDVIYNYKNGLNCFAIYLPRIS